MKEMEQSIKGIDLHNVKIEHVNVLNFDGALRGMRNPLASHEKSDSEWKFNEGTKQWMFDIGDNDLALMKKLYNAGPEHRKYLRQIFVCFDITVPLYIHRQLDTYKIGITENSYSTMHKLAAKPIAREDFAYYSFNDIGRPDMLDGVIDSCEELRKMYNETGDMDYFEALTSLLPSGYLQKRTITMNYENVINIIKQRSNHKLPEWRILTEWMRTELPCISLIMDD